MGMQIALYVALFVAAAYADIEPQRTNMTMIESDICDGKADGSYEHPDDCTRYILCYQHVAYEMFCPMCPEKQLDRCKGQNYFFFNVDKDCCYWPDETPCGEDHWCTNGETTWHEGDSCTEEDCHPCGYCHDQVFYYLRCDHTIPSDPRGNVTGVVVREECEDLYWNPDHEGGSCDFWTGLSPTWQDHWEADARCDIARDVCKWGQEKVDECSGKHWYYEPKVGTTNLTCPEDLLWHQASEGCQPCNKPVTRANGTDCPC